MKRIKAENASVDDDPEGAVRRLGLMGKWRLADQGEAMLKVIDQIELTALNAAARAKGDAPAHATLPSPDSPRYREAVAEYYRRLGNR